jgi:hypothetical protein
MPDSPTTRSSICPARGVVIKVAASALIADRVPTVLQVARWLEAEGFPSVRLVHDLDQPVRSRGHSADRLAPGCRRRPFAHRRRPRAPHPPVPRPTGTTRSPALGPYPIDRRRLAEAHGPDPADLAFLAGRCHELEAELATLRPAARPHPRRRHSGKRDLGIPETSALRRQHRPREWT